MSDEARRELLEEFADVLWNAPYNQNHEYLLDSLEKAVDEYLQATLLREERIRWEWPEIPEGWRYCENQTFSDDYSSLSRTVTDAPRDAFPFDYNRKSVQARRVEEERWVTPWKAIDASK